MIRVSISYVLDEEHQNPHKHPEPKKVSYPIFCRHGLAIKKLRCNHPDAEHRQRYEECEDNSSSRQYSKALNPRVLEFGRVHTE